MALVFCPECGRQVSNMADACPSCGYPIKKMLTEIQNDQSIDVAKLIDDYFEENKESGAYEAAVELEKIGDTYKNIDPQNCVNAYNIASMNYQNADELEKSVIVNKKALALNPKDKTALVNGKHFGNVLVKRGKIDYIGYTIKCYEDLIEFFPQDENLRNKYYDLACIYSPVTEESFGPIKDWNKAFKYYKLFLTNFPSDKKASALYQDIALYYNRQKNDLKAIAFSKLCLDSFINGVEPAERTRFENNYNTIYSNVKRNYGHKYLDNLKIVKTFEDAESFEQYCKEVRCPRCGSTSVTTGAKGPSGFFGLIGASKTVNRCAKCGCTWNPREIDWRDVFDNK